MCKSVGILRDSFLWFHCTFSSAKAHLSIDSTEPLLWFYWNTEPSTFTRRAFVIATANVRRCDGEPSATSWIQRSGSVNPLKWVKQPLARRSQILTNSLKLLSLAFVLFCAIFVRICWLITKTAIWMASLWPLTFDSKWRIKCARF